MSLLLRCFVLRCLLYICGVVMAFSIAVNFFHGFAVYVVAFLLLNCVDRTCRVLFKYPIFNQHKSLHTLNLIKS